MLSAADTQKGCCGRPAKPRARLAGSATALRHTSHVPPLTPSHRHACVPACAAAFPQPAPHTPPHLADKQRDGQPLCHRLPYRSLCGGTHALQHVHHQQHAIGQPHRRRDLAGVRAQPRVQRGRAERAAHAAAAA